MKKIAVRLLILLGLAGVVAGGFYLVQQIPRQDSEKALAPVKRGDLVVKTYLRGELRPVRSVTLTAPNLGSISQITSLAPSGALAHSKDLIMEFDESEALAALEDAQLEVEQIQQNLKKAETDLEIRKSQDEVELVKAQFAVRRAELEVKRNELISAIDARKNILTLEEARRRLRKLEQDIQSRLQQREAELAVLREQLKKAQLEVDRNNRRIERAKVLTPMSGLVSILENRSSGRGGFGQTTPVIREGDQIPAGMAVAQLLDLSEMELVAKVEELERANLRLGQETVIWLDALPGKAVRGSIKRLGNTATTNVFRGEATKKFDCVLSIDMRQLLEHVGASAEQIERILSTAKENSARGVGGSRPSAASSEPETMREPPLSAAGGQGPPVERRRIGARQAAGEQEAPREGQRGPEAGGRRARASGKSAGRRGAFGAGLSQEDRRRARQMMQQLLGGRDVQSLSEEQRRRIFQQARQALARSEGPGGPGGSSDRPGRTAASGAAEAVPQIASLSLSQNVSQPFTAEDREKAQLPAPPEEGSDVDILLRPGLLADAEVIVERISDALYVPYQGIFYVSGNPVVYVWDGSRLETRRVELGKKSESQIAILSGLEEGELISLEPPGGRERETVSKKKKAAGSSGAQPAFPGGGRPADGRESGARRRR